MYGRDPLIHSLRIVTLKSLLIRMHCSEKEDTLLVPLIDKDFYTTWFPYQYLGKNASTMHRYDEEYLLLRDMEVHDNQAGSFTQDDAILSDPDFSYDSQADDTMSIAKSPPTGFAVPEVCAITYKQCKVLKEDNTKPLITIDVLTLSDDAFAQDDEKVKFYTGLPNYGTLKNV